MKIKTTSKLLKLKLIKTKIYKKVCAFNNFKIKNIEHRLKKSLHIIQQYHIKNKKILFITPFFTAKLNNLLKYTKHTVVNKHFFSNKKSFVKLLNLKNKYNLIVIFGTWCSNNFIIENYKKKLPFIFINSSLKILNDQLNYKILVNFAFAKTSSKEHLFLILLKSLLAKKYVFK